MVICLATASQATKFAGEPYYVGVGGRALGRGGAFVASLPDASSMYWNVAATTALVRPEIIAQHAEAFGSLLNHDFVALAMPPGLSGWTWGVCGSYVGGSGIQLTVYDSTTGRPKVEREARHGDWSFAFGLARQSAHWGSWGLAVKTVVRDLPGNAAYGLGLDLAWWNRWNRLRAGIKVADATTTFLSYDSGRKETIFPHVNWGGEADLPQWAAGLRTTLAAEAETYFEGRKAADQFWSGSISVDLHLGLEVGWREQLFARVGSDAGRLAIGAGFAVGRWALDGAITDHEFLDSTYRLSLRVFLK